MRCNVYIPPSLVPLLLELRTLPEAVRLHIADILVTSSDASIASTDGEQQQSPYSARKLLMVDDVFYDESLDLKKWIESLEDEFEPMSGMPNDEQETSQYTLLDNDISNPLGEKKSPSETKDKSNGTA